MNSMTGDLWMEKKKQLAIDNADNLMKKLNKEHNIAAQLAEKF
jgi:hypothetical protein